MRNSANQKGNTGIFDGVHWGRLLIGLSLALVLSLSVHAIMLQVLHVPFPSAQIKTWVPFQVFTNVALVAGAIWLYGCIRSNHGQRARAFPAFILFILMCGFDETLRAWVMNSYCTLPPLNSAFFFGFIALSGALFPAAAAVLIALTAPYMQRRWQQGVGAILLGLLLTFAVAPLVSAAQQAGAAYLIDLAPSQGWCKLPYGPNVLVPAYLTFIEPVLACGFSVALGWKYVPRGFWVKISVFMLLALALKKQLFAASFYAAYADLPFWTALSSMGQFSLEAAVLGLTTALSWGWANNGTRSASVCMSQ